MPVIGFLSSRSPGESAAVLAGFRQGLKEADYAEGRNVHIAFRWAEGRYRSIGPWLSQRPQQFVIDNRPDAGTKVIRVANIKAE
jgi:hypothetical protein